MKVRKRREEGVTVTEPRRSVAIGLTEEVRQELFKEALASQGFSIRGLWCAYLAPALNRAMYSALVPCGISWKGEVMQSKRSTYGRFYSGRELTPSK